MAGATGGIRVKGQKELEAAFLKLRKDVLAGLKPAIVEIAEAARRDAEVRSVDEISNIGVKWSRMRVGVTPKMAYIAPRTRRSGGSPRPNLAPLLARSMQEAADSHQDEMVARLDELVAVSAARNGFVSL